VGACEEEESAACEVHKGVIDREVRLYLSEEARGAEQPDHLDEPQKPPVYIREASCAGVVQRSGTGDLMSSGASFESGFRISSTYIILSTLRRESSSSEPLINGMMSNMPVVCYKTILVCTVCGP
jgi:hypothetical protein